MKFDNVAKMYLVTLLTGLTLFGGITIPFFQSWGKLDYTQIFFLQAWFMFWYFILDIPTGALADLVGRKTVIILSGIVNGIAAVIYGSTPNFYVFMLGEFTWAVAVALMSGADKALIYDTLKETKKSSKSKKIFSRYSTFSTLGTVIALPLGSIIAGLNIWPFPDNLRLPMLLTSIPLFAGGLISLSLKEPKIQEKKSKHDYFATAKKGVKFFLKNRILKILAIDFISISVTTFFMFWFYQSLLGILKVNIVWYGVVGAAFNIFAMILLLNIGKIEKIISKKQLLLYTALIPGIFYSILAFQINIFIALIAIFLISGLRIMREPLFDSYMNKYIPSKERATTLSTISTFQRLGLMISYPLIGALADFSLQYTFLALGILTIVFAFASRVEEKML